MSRRAKGGILGGAIVAVVAIVAGVLILPFASPSSPPIVTRFRSTALFSPNGDGRRDLARISVRVSRPGRVTVTIRDERRRVVRELLTDALRRAGWVRLAWAGRDESDRRAPDGAYTIDLRAHGGPKRFSASRRILIDTHAPRPRALVVESAAIAGPGAGECRAEVTAGQDGAVTLEAVAAGAAAGGAAVAAVGPRPLEADATMRWSWDGLTASDRAVPPGLYLMRLTFGDPAGNRETRERTCWVGHLVGRPAPSPRAGARVGVRLTRVDGTPVPASTPTRLALYRRAATPGRSLGRALGPRVGAGARGPAGRVSVRLPGRLRPSALWLVATVGSGRALIPLSQGGRPR
jgi:flagellar hook capping protein FlgD